MSSRDLCCPFSAGALTLNSEQVAWCCVQSTAPTLTLPFIAVAKRSYSGARRCMGTQTIQGQADNRKCLNILQGHSKKRVLKQYKCRTLQWPHQGA